MGTLALTNPAPLLPFGSSLLLSVDAVHPALTQLSALHDMALQATEAHAQNGHSRRESIETCIAIWYVRVVFTGVLPLMSYITLAGTIAATRLCHAIGMRSLLCA